MMNISVILPAAGLGSRFAVGERKAGSKIEFELAFKPVFLRTIGLFVDRPEVGQIILAVHPDRLDDFAFRWADQLGFQGAGLPGGVKLIAGGAAERWETVKLALGAVDERATHIAVHDAARPCASGAMIERVFAAAQRYGAAVPGLAMGDTVKKVLGVGVRGLGAGDEAEQDPLDEIFGGQKREMGEVRKISETVDRAGLYRVQTPQVFERGLITEAYCQLDADNAAGVTDDASVAERAGHDVYIVEGDPLNLKLTHSEDAELLEAVLAMREAKAAKASAAKQLFGDDED